MRVTTIHGPRDIRLEDRPTPEITAPTDAIIKITAGCICGSDLWPYRGENDVTPGMPIGHEMVGVVEEVGGEVTSFRPGDFVVVPFCLCDNTCPHCRHTSSRRAGRAAWSQAARVSTAWCGRRRGAWSRPTGCPTPR